MSNQDEQHSALTDDIREIAKELQAIYLQAESTYASAVDDIIYPFSKQRHKRDRAFAGFHVRLCR